MRLGETEEITKLAKRLTLFSVLARIRFIAKAPTSPCCGSAQKLPGGNWLSDWGASQIIGEYTPAGKPVISIEFPELSSYRAQAVSEQSFPTLN